jgi:crossover junction endodeoxyribonuclease RusA
VTVTFRAAGIPAPKGSTRAFVPRGWSRPVLTADAKGLRAWADLVRAEAQGHVQALYAGPVAVALDFALPRPKALPAKRTRPHVSRPDIDKLARAILDALTGVAWPDDSRVIELHATKRYARVDEQPGVLVSLRDADIAPEPQAVPERRDTPLFTALG